LINVSGFFANEIVMEFLSIRSTVRWWCWCVEVINVSELDPHIKNPFIILRGIRAGKTPIINDNCLSHVCINSIKRHTCGQNTKLVGDNKYRSHWKIGF
jgi:hypothetical protein